MLELWSDNTARNVVLVNAASSLAMTGLIWFVQVVHYPLLARFSGEVGTRVAHEHQRRTSWVVALPMTAEGLSTLALLADAPSQVSQWWPRLGAVLLLVALASTVLLSVPLHARMSLDADPEVGRRLVVTNWPRTIAWSLRAIVTIVMIVSMLD